MTMDRAPVREEDLDPALRQRIAELHEEGRQLFRDFDRNVRQAEWHPFMPADYSIVVPALLPYVERGGRFLEWGSATGVITITADMLGFEAYGIEIDGPLVETARRLAAKYGSSARFAEGSFLPADYVWMSESGDPRLGTIGEGKSGYEELGLQLADFDLIFGYPWAGEEDVMRDLMRKKGRPGATLLINGGSQGMKVLNN